jgi:hypothetical protein
MRLRLSSSDSDAEELSARGGGSRGICGLVNSLEQYEIAPRVSIFTY